MCVLIKEVAKKWNCSERMIREYCQKGVIPFAEKKGIRKNWYIPEDWPKPPMSRRGLCNLMSNVKQIQAGASASKIKWCNSLNKEKGFEYLISAGFISDFDYGNFEESVFTIVITPRGEDLLRRDDEEYKEKTKSVETNLQGSAKLGPFEFTVGAKITGK